MLPRFAAAAVAALCLEAMSAAASPGFAAAAEESSAQPAPQATASPIVLPTLAPDTPANPYARAAIDLVTGVARRMLAPSDPNRAEGDVTYFKRFDLQIRTGANAYRNVHLHQGTRIDPRGATLEAGDRVRIGGLAEADGSLDADAITILR
jgi:hypothetical protein